MNAVVVQYMQMWLCWWCWWVMFSCERLYEGPPHSDLFGIVITGLFKLQIHSMQIYMVAYLIKTCGGGRGGLSLFALFRITPLVLWWRQIAVCSYLTYLSFHQIFCLVNGLHHCRIFNVHVPVAHITSVFHFTWRTRPWIHNTETKGEG